MSNHWLRLWHDMPTDPKFRTISRVSGQSISLVIAVYVHLMVSASRNVTRGHADVTPEDLASALDVTEDEIIAVLDAMQGRVLDGENLSGWETRQPKREDAGNDKTGAKSAAERKREQRAREKESASVTPCHDDISNVTQCHDASRTVTTDKDKDKEENIPTTTVVGMPHQPKFEAKAYLSENGVSDGVAADWLTLRKAKKAGATKTAIDGIIGEAQKAGLSLQTVLEMCCQRGWASFKASWDWEDRSRRTNNSANPTGESAYARTMRERVEELTGRKPQPAQGFDNAIDVTPTSVMIGSAL